MSEEETGTGPYDSAFDALLATPEEAADLKRRSLQARRLRFLVDRVKLDREEAAEFLNVTPDVIAALYAGRISQLSGHTLDTMMIEGLSVLSHKAESNKIAELYPEIQTIAWPDADERQKDVTRAGILSTLATIHAVLFEA